MQGGGGSLGASDTLSDVTTSLQPECFCVSEADCNIRPGGGKLPVSDLRTAAGSAYNSSTHSLTC